jgi:ribosome-associated protein
MGIVPAMNVEISRSEQKRRMKQLEKLVAELSGLPPSVINQLPCAEEVRTLFHEAATMKGGTRNRQIKYITKLLKEEPVEELYTFLSERTGVALQEKKEFHEVEYLREALLSEAIEQYREARHNHLDFAENWPSSVAETICSEYPGIDRILLTRLARMYAGTRNRKHSRELFRLIRAAHEQAIFHAKNNNDSKNGK